MSFGYDGTYRPELAPALRAVWDGATGGALPLTARVWEQQVERHPLFHPEDCLVASAPDGGLAGFALIRTLRAGDLAAEPDLAREQGQGHVMALAVLPRWRRQGIGSRLLAAAEARLRAAGATRLCLWGPSGHLVPGPPVEPGTLAFAAQAGYTLREEVHDLRRSLDDWAPPPPPRAVAAGDFHYRQGRPGEEAAILGFLSATFPGGWCYQVAQAFAQGYAPGDITLLCDQAGATQGFLCAFHPQSGILGPSTFWYPLLAPRAWGGMGPLGIAPGVRGAGLGLGLVAAGTTYLHARGVRDCCIDWTRLLAFYGRLGFTPWKAWAILEKPDGPGPGGGHPG